jgi:hypothetical protein
MKDREEDQKGKLIELVRKAAPSEPPQSVQITGHGNIVGHGNTVIHAPIVRPRNVIDPRASDLTEAQKLKLRDLVNDWVNAYNTIRVRAKPLTYGAAWSSFQRKFRITSYHLLPADRFDEACAWLKTQRARIDNMKTAPRRDPAWRARQIAYIKARCKNQLGDEYRYRPYIKRRFGKTSLAALEDDELAATKAYIARLSPV